MYYGKTCPHGIKPKGNCKECKQEANRKGVSKHYYAHKQEHKAKFDKWVSGHRRKYLTMARVRYSARRARILGNGGKYTVAEWKALKEFYDFTCLACKRKEPEIQLTPDHVTPLSKGGSNSIHNIQPLCLMCNKSKFTKIIDYR